MSSKTQYRKALGELMRKEPLLAIHGTQWRKGRTKYILSKPERYWHFRLIERGTGKYIMLPFVSSEWTPIYNYLVKEKFKLVYTKELKSLLRV
jgi:hypothetical protein